MTRPDLARFAKLMLVLATTTRAEIDDPTIELYFRALSHAPIDLLEEAAVELAATAKFMPRPADWLEAVDELLDRRERLRAIGDGRGTQAALPGEIGAYVCPDCDNTGWTVRADPCTRNLRVCPEEAHTHEVAVRCVNKYCVAARQQAAERRRRYSKERAS